MINLKKSAILLGIAVVCTEGFVACDDDDEFSAIHQLPTTSNNDNQQTNNGYEKTDLLEANRFVYEVMSTYYYWVDEMPHLNYRQESDTENYFYKLLSSKDRFSFISNDAEAEAESDQGIATSKGWLYTLARMGTDTIAAIIKYTYAGSPSRNADVRRGDLLIKVDDELMTAKNYSTLMSKTSGKYTFLRYDAEKDELVSVEKEFSNAKIIENPVAETCILNTESGTKVGYLLYNSYKSAFNEYLTEAAKTFAAEDVKDVILDIRYNQGGELEACRHLCSLLAPKDVVKEGKELLFYEFNSILSEIDGYSRQNYSETFMNELEEYNLNLNKLVVLTGGNSYSASEATIWGLKPYMDITTVGDTTGGKNSMMFVLTPEDFVDNNENPYYSSTINNWYMAPIVAVYKNSTGVSFDTSNGYGLTPDVYVDEFSSLRKGSLGEIGTTSDPLTAAALKYIDNGYSVDGNKSLQQPAEKVSEIVSGGFNGRGGAMVYPKNKFKINN